MRMVRLFVFTTVVCSSLHAASMMELFHGHYGTIEVYDANKKLSFRVNPPRVTEKIPACGTALLPVVIIALKSGVLKPGATRINAPSDAGVAAADTPKMWARSQSLRQAFRYATPWYLQELATRVGGANLRAGAPSLANFEPASLSRSPLEWKWSALDQVELLKKVHNHQLGLTPAADKALRDALRLEKSGADTLWGFGSRCLLDPKTALGSYLGIAQRGKELAFYATNLEGKNLAALRGEARRISIASLGQMDYWPVQP
jgi:bla regulator protein blaR1